MAGKGTYAAYQQLNPIQADFGDPMERFADRVIASQDKKRAYEDQKRRERMAMSEKFDAELQALEPVITGVQSVDEINYQAFSDSASQLGEIHRQILANPSMAMDPNLRMRRANLINSPKILKAAEARITSQYQKLTEGLANGTLSGWEKDQLDEMQAYYGVKQEDGTYSPNYIIKYDDKGQMYFAVKGADGRLSRKSVPAIINGYEYGDFAQAVKVDEWVKNYTDSLGKDQVIGRAPGGTAIYQKWTQGLEDSQREILRTKLYDGDGGPSDFAKSVWVEGMGKSKADFGEDSLQQMEEYLIGRVRDGYDKTISGYSRDPQPSSSPMSKYLQETYEIQSRITPMTNEEGGFLTYEKSGGDVQEGPKRKGEGDYFGINIPGDLFKLRMGDAGETVVNAVYYDPKSGRMKARGLEKEPTPGVIVKSSTEGDTGQPYPKYTEKYLNQEEMNNLASILRFQNTKQLKEHFNKILGTSSGGAGIEWQN